MFAGPVAECRPFACLRQPARRGATGEGAAGFAEPGDGGTLKFSKVTARGRTTIPKSIREAAGLYAGDVLVFETDGDQVVVRKAARARDDHLRGLSDALSEWTSPQDEEAWRDL